jgi:asparagine synthase (glutamine-hydrolysing)
MCGIAGIISLTDLVVSKQALTTMANAIAHRGPDDEGYWTNEMQSVGFAHKRLSIIDLSHEAAQPMHYANRYTIVYNGEIYNYIELRETLYKKGYRFQTQSDTEVIIAAYDCLKEKCVHHLNGMFAFGIWDNKDQTFFAARDRFGEKPFYYYLDDEQLVFASEMKALWAVGIEKKADDKMLLNYLAVGHVKNAADREETFFEDIYVLPPSNYLLLSARTKKFQTKRYWKIDKEKTVDIAEADAIEHFNELLTESVKRRLRGDVQLGINLSGGLDSSSIAATIASIKNDRATAGRFKGEIQTFSATFPGFAKDESAYIKSVTAKFNLPNFQVQPTAAGLVNDFEKLCYHQEEPFSSSSIYAQYKVFELAKEHGIKALIDGQGADETMAGYHKYLHWYLQELLAKRKFTSVKKEKQALRENGLSFAWNIKNYLAAYFPAHAVIGLEQREYNTIMHHPDIDKSFMASLQGRGWEGVYKPNVAKLNDVLYYNTIKSGLQELLRYADRNSMAHGREARFPFLDHELVSFIFSLPANLKIHNGWTKSVLRKTMDKKLPDAIVWRKDKVGYEPPQEQWMQNPAMKEYIQEAKRKLVNKGILKQEVLNKKIVPKGAHESCNYDWRYLCAAQTLF